jgi:hypothetical protein
VITWYARTARAADTLVSPGLPRLEAELDQVDELLPLADQPHALAWLTTELLNRTGALRSALNHQWFTAEVVARHGLSGKQILNLPSWGLD